MRSGESPLAVTTFFRSDEPLSGNGWARLAEAHLATGKPAEALVAAQSAWKAPDLSTADEGLLIARFGPQFTAADYDRRIDALLFAKRASDAQRLLPWSSADAARLVQRPPCAADALARRRTLLRRRHRRAWRAMPGC